MPPIVFDTNGIVSAALLPRSVSRLAFQKARQSFQMVTSTICYTELADVLMRQKFRKYLSVQDAVSFLDEFAQITTTIHITCSVNDCRDVKDNKFLELAISAGAQYIVTGDMDLLIMNPYNEITILTAADFIKI